MNNMPFPYMPDMNMMGGSYQYQKIAELEQKIDRLERQMRRLEKKVSELEEKNPKPISSTPNEANDNSSIYMV